MLLVASLTIGEKPGEPLARIVVPVWLSSATTPPLDAVRPAGKPVTVNFVVDTIVATVNLPS